jgi:UDP-N-acetylmuramoylalanine--D-glutamate ligase
VHIDLRNKKVGVWGSGIVGKSVINFLKNEECAISVCDKKEPDQGFLEKLKNEKIIYYPQAEIETFLAHNDYIIPSPGIDLRAYLKKYSEKFICELDLFAHHFKKPIIAVTGTVGKTTITGALSVIIAQYGLPFVTGGNIGVGTLDFARESERFDGALLELSSFQLAYIKDFKPTLAIITNVSANHLDWHGSMDDYLRAKWQLLAYQTTADSALIPWDLYNQLATLPSVRSTLNFFALACPPLDQLKNLPSTSTLFYIDQGIIMSYCQGIVTPLITLDKFPAITFTENWLIITATLSLMNLPLEQAPTYAHAVRLAPHRLEKIATWHDIAIYNDSKSTTPAATLAAIEALRNQPIILFIGGMGKGIDREPLIQSLCNKVKKIYCFGGEAEMLKVWCDKYALESYAYPTLEPALEHCLTTSAPRDQIVFSPAGSSFDLFANYEHRGTHFTALVNKYIATHP